MNIQILGSASSHCEEAENIISEAIVNVGIHASVEKITTSPNQAPLAPSKSLLILVDGKVLCEGRVPKRTEIENYFKTVLISKGCPCGCH